MHTIVKKFLILFFLFLFFIDSYFVDAKAYKPLSGIIISLDPGHGGRDPGTRYGKTLEKNLNLKISKSLKKSLENKGATVYLVREKDIDFSYDTDYLKKRSDLKRRINFIKSKKSNLYLSIHLNWYNDYYYGGSEILYNNINKNNKLFATILTKKLKDNNIKTREMTTTNLFLYRNISTLGVLVECGFLSNRNDRYLIQTESYRKKFSDAITDGIVSYYKFYK